LEPDGFVIRNSGTHIILAGGAHKGTLYAVYTFLEKYLGCRFFAPDAEIVPVNKEIILPGINYSGQPAFRDREVYIPLWKTGLPDKKPLRPFGLGQQP